MDQQSLPKLPVINFCDESLKAGSQSWFFACNDVRRALEEYGCFIAMYGNISLELRDKIFLAFEELFNFPTATKAQNTSDTPFFGYFGHSEFPLHESMGIEDATTLERIQSFSKLMWPNGNDNFCETIHEYAKLLSDLEKMVTKMVFESYNVDQKHCDSHIGSTTHLLRFNKYRVAREDETNIGSHVHTDKSFITILDQNQVNGLEVKTKDDQWIAVDFLPSSFVVMAGDGLMAWSNSRVQPAFHRVVMTAKETRYSIAMFSFRKGIVEIPKELIDEEHPRCFHPFDHLGILSFFAKQMQLGRLSESTVQAYCGV